MDVNINLFAGRLMDADFEIYLKNRGPSRSPVFFGGIYPEKQLVPGKQCRLM